MSDFSKTYSQLVIQPIDLINAFKIEFCFASVIKWLTKWHMNKTQENLSKVRYYTSLCKNINEPIGLRFALRMYCLSNGFIKSTNQECLLTEVTDLIFAGMLDDAITITKVRSSI